jgi:putative oxidoreductase
MSLSGIFFFQGAQRVMGWFGGAGWNGTMEAWTSPEGLGWPVLLVAIFLAGELLVSLSLFLGLFTRLGGLAVVATMSAKIAILARHSPDLVSLELPVMLWAAGLALLCLGGGALSTDRAISENLLPIVG